MFFVHGDNLKQKEKGSTKYKDGTSIQYLKEIRAEYNIWNSKNNDLLGPFKEESDSDYEIIKKRVELLNEYKNF